jgi:hypothetical protein
VLFICPILVRYLLVCVVLDYFGGLHLLYEFQPHITLEPSHLVPLILWMLSMDPAGGASENDQLLVMERKAVFFGYRQHYEGTCTMEWCLECACVVLADVTWTRGDMR